MPLLLQPRDQAEKYTVVAGDTLAKIASKKCATLGWKLLARYNFGTELPAEVQRALCETVGVKVADLPKDGDAPKPEDLALAPDADLAPKLLIPKAWTASGMAVEKTHTVKVKPLLPASAVSLTALDKWFIPEHEKCEVKYALQGKRDQADKLVFDVYGSQYCDASAWNKGVGTFTAPSAMLDVFIARIDLATQAAERSAYELPADGWKGEATTTFGMLGRKTGTAAKRFINVAFSPYTAHFRYFKADADKSAHLVLEPFWPQWEEDKLTPTTAGRGSSRAGDGGHYKISWINAAKVDRGTIEVFDVEGQRVHLRELVADELKANNFEPLWDKAYRADARNGKFAQAFIDDSGASPEELRDELLFQSTPYKFVVTTFTRKPKAESLKIKWEVRQTSKLDEGMLEIVDGKDKLVFQKPLAKGKLGQAKQEFVWDGKYAEGIKNSADGTEIIPDDMPYRVRLSAHTKANTVEALAIAVMHTEVRIFVHKETHAPDEPRYDPWNAKPGMALTLGPWVPGDAPTAGTALNRYKLAEFGFHPGPVNAGAAAITEFQTALREFKRSVPADGVAVAPNFLRQNLAGGNDVAENGELTAAINSIRPGDKRRLLGDAAKVTANNDAPDLSNDEIKEKLGDPAKDVIVWVDDRQYFTEASTEKDDNGDPFTTGTDAKLNFGLNNYRGQMSVGDAKATLDKAAVPRPWIPLKAELSLLSRTDTLYPDYDKAKVVIDDAALRKKMSAAIGPLRMDWSFDELPPDLDAIGTGYDHTKMRARKYVAWALFDKRRPHKRKDTARTHHYANCPETLGGLRPDALAGYYENAFGTDTLRLEPWEAKAVAETETVATVVHEHICAAQVAKTDLFEPLLGSAGAFFRPSIVAGDGYRVRAALCFDKFDGYAFPNLPALKARYPVAPATHSARLRVWRRTSVRGYICWGAATGHWPGYLNQLRDKYRNAHVYLVHEGGAARTFDAVGANGAFNPANPAHVDRYKKLIAANVFDPVHKDPANITLNPDMVWPYSAASHYGHPYVSPVDILDSEVWQKFLHDTISQQSWPQHYGALILCLVQHAEASGAMRGHLFVEFTCSGKVHLTKYQCNRHGTQGSQHVYWKFYKGDAGTGGSDFASFNCMSPACFSSPTTQGGQPVPSNCIKTNVLYAYDYLPLPAVGIALGSTWLFSNSNAGTWAHEMAHHRHLEHAATAGGAQYSNYPGTPELHDSEVNDVAFTGPHDGSQRWDRDCEMSYTVNEVLCFCGKCLLRNRGWMVQALGYPGSRVREPT